MRKRDAGSERRDVRMGELQMEECGEREREEGIERVPGRRGDSIELESDYKKT